jgi:adenylylsulfate kinase
VGTLKETRTRSIVKAVIWRLIALAVTYSVVWLFTGSIETSIIITLIANLLKTVLYYALERIFQRVEWGII